MTDTSTFGRLPAPDAAEPGSATDAAREQAANVASTAKEQTANVASAAATEAQAVAGQVAQEAKDMFADARQQLQSQAAEQSDRVAALLGDVGGQLRTMADAGQPGMARDLVSQVAGGAQQLADRLGGGGLDGTLQDARRLARNRPGLFLLGAAAAGLVAARVARHADTTAITDAAKPTDASPEAPTALGASPDLSLEATASVPALSGPATAPVPMDGRP